MPVFAGIEEIERSYRRSSHGGSERADGEDDSDDARSFISFNPAPRQRNQKINPMGRQRSRMPIVAFDVSISDFEGNMNGMNPDDYFDWIASIEAFFEWKEFSEENEEKKVRYVTAKKGLRGQSRSLFWSR